VSDAPDVTIEPPPPDKAPEPCGRCKATRAPGKRIGWAGITVAYVSTGGVIVRKKHPLCPSCSAGLLAWLDRRQRA
jgi:ribosomal protein S27AE